MAEDAPLDDTPTRQMSLIPYTFQTSDIVLRRGNAVVLRDPQTEQLSVQQVADQSLELSNCPTCGRPWRDEGRGSTDEHERPSSAGFAEERHYVAPNYFGLLSENQRSSPPASVGPSTSRIPAALRSGRSREASGAHDTPSGAQAKSSEPAVSSTEGISAAAFDPGYFQRNFKELRLLGKGGNGVVLLVEHLKDRVSLGHYACKRVPVGNDHEWLEKVLREVQTMQQLRHPNIVAYYWVWLEDHQASPFAPLIPCLWMLQEYCDAGDLHTLVVGPNEKGPSTTEKLKDRMRRRSKGEESPPKDVRPASKLSLNEIFMFFTDITSGLHYLHSQEYLHRDLKPSNCLLRRTKHGLQVMISDFGEVQAEGAKRKSTGATGTISYCAPEVLQLNATDGTYGEFTPKSDVFSLGMIVYFMCFGRLPYVSTDGVDEDNEDLDQLRSEILKWTGFDEHTRVRADLPDQLYRYLKRLLSVDPNERPSTDEIDQAIKGGVGLADVSSFGPDVTSRISSADVPTRRPSSQGSKPFSRPGLSTLLRHRSDDTVRQLSPTRAKQRNGSNSMGNSRPTSPVYGSIVMHPRKIDLPPNEADVEPQQSPRLMLPPPEHPSPSRYARVTAQLSSLSLARALVFVAKVLSMTKPCAPYQPNVLLFFPLLLAAMVDSRTETLLSRRSVFLLALHIMVVILAQQQGRLCEVRRVQWRET